MRAAWHSKTHVLLRRFEAATSFAGTELSLVWPGDDTAGILDSSEIYLHHLPASCVAVNTMPYLKAMLRFKMITEMQSHAAPIDAKPTGGRTQHVKRAAA